MDGCDRADAEQLDELVGGVQQLLGGLMVAAYLHGSAARQQMRSRSDLDVLVVTTTSLAERERAGLAELLLRLSGRHPRTPGGPRPVELTVVGRSEVQPWRYPPHIDFLYGEWLREEFESGRLAPPRTNPDLTMVLVAVLTYGVPLLGPPATAVLDPVPVNDAVTATRAGVPTLLADLDSDTTNVLLTLARGWYTVTTGQIASKEQAAEWALPRLPAHEQTVVKYAWSIHLDKVHEDWEPLRSDVYTTAEALAARIG